MSLLPERQLVDAMPEARVRELLAGVIWNFFGEVDDDTNFVIVPRRPFNEEDARMAHGYLAEELWPEEKVDGA